MSKSNPKTLGITIGDPCGIGPEVTAKALAKIYSLPVQFVIFGSESVISRYKFPKKKNISYIYTLSQKENFLPGKPTFQSARASFRYLETAIEFIRMNKLQALVTGPVCKENIIYWQDKFQGHTEFLAENFAVKNFEMMFVAPGMRVVILTRHVPIKNISSLITQKNIYTTISTVWQGLKTHFGIKNPRIVLCGLNPHAGEGGKLGKEELLEIIPAIKKAQKKGISVTGPLAADTLFLPEKIKQFDCIVAMYHDQGLIPIKQSHFKTVVNFTLGLPFIRTSPAHGTAFDIAGKNKADSSSMKSAIELACQLL